MTREGEHEQAARVLTPGALGGQVALVTGAGSGIGRAAALRLCDLGAVVHGLGRQDTTLQETKALADEARGRFHPVVCDLRDPEATTRAVEQIGDRHGIGAIVHSAGGQFYAHAHHISYNGWRAVVDLNLDAVFTLMRASGPYLRQGGGSVVSLSLAFVDRGAPGMAHSIAARAGVLGLFRTLALEWAADGVRLNCLGPGTVLTSALVDNQTPEALDRMVTTATPMARPTSITEVAEFIAFLLSPAAAMVTGQLLHVDGGAHIGPGIELLRKGVSE